MSSAPLPQDGPGETGAEQAAPGEDLLHNLQQAEQAEAAPPSTPARGVPMALFFPNQRPWATYILFGLTAIVFLAQLGTETLLGVDLPAYLGMKVNELIAEGQFWRLITPVLLHGSLIHVGFNLYALWVMGPTIERFFGWQRFLALYLLSGFAGNVFSLTFTDNPSLGSSTAIFGLLAAQGVFLYLNRSIFGAAGRSAIQNVLMVAAINFVIGFSPRIDNWGHLGGFAAGALFTYFAGPLLRLELFPAPRAHDDRPERVVWLTWLWISLLFVFWTLAVLFLRG